MANGKDEFPFASIELDGEQAARGFFVMLVLLHRKEILNRDEVNLIVKVSQADDWEKIMNDYSAILGIQVKSIA